MASKYWIKLYHEILDDPKMGRLDDRSFRRTIELFLLAGELDNEGELPMVDDMAWRLRIDPSEMEDDLQALQEVGIVTQAEGVWTVTKFADRQGQMPDAERKRRERTDRQRQEYYGRELSETCPNTVRMSDADIDIDKDIESDKDTDKELILNMTGDLFDDCLVVWETKTGKKFMPGTDFADMIKVFEQVGVTAEIYGKAIEEQRLSSYKVKSPTSVKSWAIGIAEQISNPRKKQSAQKESVSEYNTRIVKEIMDGKL